MIGRRSSLAIGLAAMLWCAATPAGQGSAVGINRARLLDGAIDVHVHSYPDDRPRSIDAIEVAKLAQARRLRAIVLKNHYDSTAGLAFLVRKVVPDIEVFGGVALNLTVGGINAAAVEHMAAVSGGWGRIVWMPSWDSENSIHKLARKPFAFVPVAHCKGLPFWIDYPKPCPDGGELLPEAKEAMQVIATTKTRDSNGDLVLATGHNSPPEVKLMVKEAVRVGVKHIIITHPLLDIVDMTPAEIKETVAMGPEIYAEFTSGFGNPNARPDIVKRYVEGIRAAGVEHAFVSSDTGQLNSNWQPDALANCAKVLRANGFTERELDLLFKINPAKILGIAPPATGTR